MKNRVYLSFVIVLSLMLGSCKQEIKVNESSLTAINPLSYTDVIFKSDRDTVFVSTFSGRIAKRINGHNEEKLLIDLGDEIYSLAYDQNRNLIYASTRNSGVVIIEEDKMTVIDHLFIEGSWISDIFLSKDGMLLAGYSANGQNHIWNIKNNTRVIIPDSLSNYRVAGIDESGNIILKGRGNYVFWNSQMNMVEKKITVSGILKDIDESGNMLLFFDKDFQFYNVNTDSVSFRKHHKDWPYYLKDQDTVVRVPLQLSLTVGRLTNKYLFTAGVDRSIRKWNKIDGQHIEDIIEHKATISAMNCSPDKTQLVSVDLKGGILFSEINYRAVNKE